MRINIWTVSSVCVRHHVEDTGIVVAKHRFATAALRGVECGPRGEDRPDRP